MRQQFLFFGGAIMSIPFLPLLAWQGKKIRANIPSLPEANQPFDGKIGEGQHPIRVLTLGESTIAGVGVENHQLGISGQLAEELGRLTKHSIYWQVLAKSGYTAKMVKELLVPQIPKQKFDLIIIGLGGNDTFKLNSPGQWRKDFEALIKAVRLKQSQSKIVIANMPPVGAFPAFTKLMQLVLGNLVRLHGQAIANFPKQFENLYYIDKEIRFEEWLNKVEAPSSVDSFFSDGVHPSPITYSIWGKEIAKFIVDQKLVEQKSV